LVDVLTRTRDIEMKRRIVPALFGLVFLAVGIGVTAWGWNVLGDAKASTSWPSVDGSVISSKVERERTSRRSGGRRRTSTTYGAEVRYRYSVDGNEYSSDKVSFGDYSSSNRARAQGIVDRYPVGKTVQVYYDPNTPETAVLESGTSWSCYLPIGLGIIFTIVGALVSAGSLIRKT